MTKWKKLEEDKDLRLEQKGKHGMDSRQVWFVVETEAERQKIIDEHPEYEGRILVCSRDNIQDTRSKKSVDDTMQLHEIVSVLTERTILVSRRY